MSKIRLLLIPIFLNLFSASLLAQSFAPVPSLSFVKPFAGADPLPQIITVTSASTNFDFTYAATSTGNWLSVTAVGFNCCATPRALTIVVTTSAAMPVGSYAGQVKLTDFSNSAITMTVPVTLTVEPAAGTFFDSLPGQLSFALKTGAAIVTSQDVQIRNGGSGTLNWSASKSTADGGNWLTVSATSGTAPSRITVGISVSNLPGGGAVAGHFIGQIVLSQGSGGSVTIPISVTVGANIFSQVNGISFTKVFGGADPLPQILTIASTGTNFNFDTNSYNSAGGTWLSVNAVGFNCCATARELTAVVTTSPALPVGTYTGEIVVTVEGDGNMAITIPVTLTVEPAGGTLFNSLPGQLSFAMKTGGTTITSQTVQIRNGGAGILNWTLATNTSDAGNWLNVSLPSGAAPSLVTVGISVANLPGGGLIAGHFLGELVLSQTSGGSVTIPISVVVGDNVFTQVNGINFTKVFGGVDPLPQTLSVPSTGTNFDFAINTYTSTGGNWLSVSTVGFNCCATPRELTVIVTTSPALAVGTYTGEIVVTATTGSMALSVPVTLTVEPSGGTFFDNLPGQLSFSMKTGGTKITSQEIQVRNGGTGTLNWTAATQTADAGSWLTISQASGTAPSFVSVGITVANLPGGGLIAGTYIGQIVFSEPSGGSVTIPVSVVVGANIFAQANGISFTKLFGGADPLPQTVTVPSTGTNFNFDINTYTSTGGNWLSVTVVGFNCCTTPRALTVVVTTSPTMPAGTYTGEIVVTAESSGSMAMTVPVTLTVEPVNATFLDDMQGQMSFSFVPGAGNPTMQAVQVRMRGSAATDWTLAATTADGGNWLSVSATTGTAPSTVNVGVVSAALPSGGLVAGTFIGELVFRSASSTITIPVSVTVGANVFVQLPAVTFAKAFGGSNPASQDLNIASTGSNFNFDHFWYTANGGNWLSVTVAGFNCCTTPRAITANIIASAALAPGTYTGQIVATVEGNGSEAMTIPVILTVTAIPAILATPTPGTTLSGSSVTFGWTAGIGATAYSLDVGTSPGAGNIFSQNVGNVTSQTVNGIPTNGATIYVRLGSLIGGVFQYTSYTYTAAGAPGPPAAVSSSPSSGTGTTRQFTFTFSDPRGYLDLNVVNILVKNGLDAHNACYLAYIVPISTLALVDDAGEAGGPFAGVVALGNGATISNSQCGVTLVSAVGSGQTLTLVLNITFTANFGGNKILFLAARDLSGGNSDWQRLGVWQVPFTPAGTITVTSMTPARTDAAAGTAQAYTFAWMDTKGAADIGITNVLVRNGLDAKSACYLAYIASINTVALVDDLGDAGGPFAGTLVPGSATTIQNSQCAVSGAGGSAVANGTTLTLTLQITFNTAFRGNQVVYMAARDVNNLNNTDWQAMGTAGVQ